MITTLCKMTYSGRPILFHWCLCVQTRAHSATRWTYSRTTRRLATLFLNRSLCSRSRIQIQTPNWTSFACLRWWLSRLLSWKMLISLANKTLISHSLTMVRRCARTPKMTQGRMLIGMRSFVWHRFRIKLSQANVLFSRPTIMILMLTTCLELPKRSRMSTW